MALWGNNDNIVSSGTVTLNYASRVVTGAGTSLDLLLLLQELPLEIQLL